ncbi:MAG: 2OG-Fe(II) oxygenase [Candidatus Sericytochromatia bacterium]|nr:2OG-Fe(II) oxygenase [Candidatus Sericytochromatia bacterium]
MLTQEELEFKSTQTIYLPLFNQEESNKVLEQIKSLDYKDALVGDTYKSGFEFNNKLDIKQKGTRISKNSQLPYNPEYKWIYDKIVDVVSECNKNFFKHSVLEFQAFQILEYESGGRFDWHMDMGGAHPYTKRLISIVVFLSDKNDYEGGQLEFMPYLKKPLAMEQGSIVLFSSHKLHRVTPITKGIRRTLVAWVYSEVI